jgi:arylsulfatase A-like enzyme
MTKRLTVLIAIIAAAAFLPAPPPHAQSLEKPNVLIIMTDDQRASSDGLSVMDDTRRIFGQGGMYFPNGVVTTPLCCPSRASTFTGRYAHNTRVIGNNGDPLDQTTTLQYHLQQNLGYKTALTGKYLNDFTGGTPPFFDLVALRVAYNDSSGVYGTTFLRNQAISFLNNFEQNDTQPWFMYVTPFAPHPPSTPESKYKTAPVPPWEDNPARTESDLSDKPPYVLKQQVSKTTIQKLRVNMIRTLYSVDDLAAAVFAELERLGETNTLAFFLSDNGYQWYEHGLDKKGKPYDDSIQVPFFVRWPGHVPAGVVDNKVVANIDIAPTIYEALGYSPANYVPDGRSVLTSQRSTILTEGFGRGFSSLWSPDWMYVEYKDGFLEYYGPNDPWQLDNGFKTGNPPANAEELRSQLRSYKICIGTTCP